MDSKSVGGARQARLPDERSSASAGCTTRRSSSAAISFSSLDTIRDAETASYLQLAPRLLSRQQAAAYCGLSPSAFSNWVRSGKLPPPLPGTTRWDLKAIDFALDALSGLQKHQEATALDEWRAKRARRIEGNS
jgi:predicted DNA-binding transcriptional regulator AlpA